MNIYREAFYAIIFVLIISNTTYGQHYWYAKTGLNYSTLENLKDIKPGFGYNIAVGREWNVYNTFYLSLGLEYSVRSFTLKDKTIGPVSYMGVYNMGRSVYNYDLEGKISYIEIPVNLKYKFVVGKNWKMSVHFGCSKSYPYKDYTRLKQKEYLFEYENALYDKIFRFKLPENAFPAYQSGYILNVGFGFIYKYYCLEIEYQKDTRDLIYLDSLLGIYGEMNNFRISLVVII